MVPNENYNSGISIAALYSADSYFAIDGKVALSSDPILLYCMFMKVSINWSHTQLHIELDSTLNKSKESHSNSACIEAGMACLCRTRASTINKEHNHAHRPAFTHIPKSGL